MNKDYFQKFELGFPWPTQDPFLFCAYHNDLYPQSNGNLGIPKELMQGRDLGSDFRIQDGFRMYHGAPIPGFPSHPHRGFETVTLARKGLVDHSDSLGGAARYGNGDVQWMTAGDGIQHSEMFPLLNTDFPNELDLFQIWLNLPAKNKRVPPEAIMFWENEIPKFFEFDTNGNRVKIEVLAGSYKNNTPPQPPKNSWAADPNNCVLILIVELDPGAEWTLAGMETAIGRTLYHTKGDSLQANDWVLETLEGVALNSTQSIRFKNGNTPSTLLLLQGKAIGEPVAQHGPFVMNHQREIHEAIQDYRRTQFGGWPWPKDDPTHGPEPKRFWRTPEGELQSPPAK